MRGIVVVFCAVHTMMWAAPQTPVDATAVMAKVAENVERATDARKQYVYHQLVRSSLTRANGHVARREKREYSVIPGDARSEKKLVSFSGEYQKGKQMIPYTEEKYHYKGVDIDGDLLADLTNGLVNDKESRDGIPHSLFPIRSKDIPAYDFHLKGESQVNGRRTYQIGFEPKKDWKPVAKKDEPGPHDDDDDAPCWKGDAWVDADELQPVRIQTDLTWSIPWGVRVFLGTNIRQTGFSVAYTRVAENVWFPITYGTEFKVNVLWGYKRTIALAMDSNGFQKTDATSKIEYKTAGE